MGEYFAAVATTLLFTGIVSYLLVKADIEGIRSEWPKRRCELPIMIAAGLIKPPDDPKTRIQFATDNFSYCIGKIITTVAREAMAPTVGVLGNQVNVTNSFMGPMNNIRNMLRRGVETFRTMLDKQYRQYSLISATVLKIWQHLRFAMGRIQGIMYSVLYTGLTINTLIQNFIDFMFFAIMVFLGILIAMIFFLFFVLFPVIPVIVAVIAVMVSVGIGAAAGMSGAFCIDPKANVLLANGKIKPLGEIQVGDTLASKTKSENIVTGRLIVDSKDIQLILLDGILMSGTHSVKFEDRWILAQDHPNAQAVFEKLPILICLNTTQHEVILKSDVETEIIASDWEEVSDEQGRKEWIRMVHENLNTNRTKLEKYPSEIPLVSPNTKVICEKRGVVPIESIQIGDSIYADDCFTKVLGIYEGQISLESGENPEWISDGVWTRNKEGFWTTADGITCGSSKCKARGLFLVTEHEVFRIKIGNTYSLVRDFTEIGASQIDKTYDTLNYVMNKK
jgi:hypothetical protein